MPNELTELKVREVSLVDRPANSETINGKKVARATVAIWKRDGEDELWKAADGQMVDGKVFPRGDFAYTPSDNSSEWKLRLTSTPGGSPDPGIVGAAAAALGPGFRGKTVQIPASARAAVVDRVRAAWRKANPDRKDDEMPDGIKKGETTVTLEELEQKVNKVETDNAVIKTENAVLKTDNQFLKAENDAVIKMSKAERKAYAMMDTDTRKEYMAGDAAKRKEMMDAACKSMAEKSLVDEHLSDVDKEEFAKAGPAKRTALLKIAEEVAKKKAKGKNPFADDEPDGDEEDEMDKKKTAKVEKAEKVVEKVDNVLVMKAADLEDRLAKAEAVIKAERIEKRLNHFIGIAKTELKNNVGTDVEKGDMLMKMADALGEDSESYKKYFATLQQANKAMTVAFGEVGKAGGGPLPAEKVLEAKAQEIAKRDNINLGAAMAKAGEENPDLWIEMDMQHRRAAMPA